MQPNVSPSVTDSYNNITLVVGGNDCDKPSPPSAESVRHDFEELINTSLSKSKSVTVCSIAPRVTTEEIKETISSVNAKLVALCEEKENVTFVDIDLMFKLSDGSFNDGYLMGDGVHLTDKALNKIALKLNLRMKYKDGGCVTDRMQMGASYEMRVGLRFRLIELAKQRICSRNETPMCRLHMKDGKP